MGGYSLKSPLLLLILIVVCSAFSTCYASRGHHHWRAKQEGNGKTNGGASDHVINLSSSSGSNSELSPSPSPTPAPPIPRATKFNVLDYGAKGDGITDDTKAFQAAWLVACKVESSTVVIPMEYEFLVGPISFSGPCQPDLVFQLDGTIVAPTNPKPWGSGLLQWLQFTKLREGITIQGNGTIEGQGSVWWTKSHLNSDQIDGSELSGKMPSTKPTALRFYGSYNVTVSGITIQNSPKCHLKFDNCEAIHVFDMTVSSPGDSPNTDGIHLQNSFDVAIHHSNLACGDDCVSIQTGCSNVHIHDVNCGPGHGISIGGLGKDKTTACVHNITVQNVNMINTSNGVRIKTWQGGLGSVSDVKFSNITVSDVQTPIIIDQFYCDGSQCKNQSSAVALSGITYENIIGTYTFRPVYLACSTNVPCSDISLADIQLEPSEQASHTYDPFCSAAYGELHEPTVPPIQCLQSAKPMSNLISFAQDLC